MTFVTKARAAAAVLAAAVMSSVCAQTAEEKIAALTGGKEARVGVAWIAGGRAHTAGNDGCYPLMSVFKLHGATALLRQMERRGTPVDTMIRIERRLMTEDTYTPMLERHKEDCFEISLDSLIHYSVSESDNNACDMIIAMAGGTEGVNAEMQAIGLTDFRLSETEGSMQADPVRSYNNCSTPLSVATLFRKLYEEDILGGPYAAMLKSALTSTVTGPDKIKAALAPGMTLAHKTGTGFTLPDGTKTADNDAGVITLPDGRRIYIAVLITDTRLGNKANAALIAEIAGTVIADEQRADK